MLVLMAFLIFSAAGWTVLAQEKPPAAQSDKAYCGSTKLVRFGFKDPDHTQFLIPEAYLFDPYNIFHKVKIPAEFIVIRIDRKSFLPICNKQTTAKDFIKITLKPSSLNGFSIFSKNMKNLYLDRSDEKEIDFDLYKNKNQEPSIGKSDFFIPKKDFSSNPMFMKCSYSQKRTNQRSGCEVHSLISDHVRAEYGIDASDLAQVKIINEKIKKIVSSFKVN